jgi:hypothetical protein
VKKIKRKKRKLKKWNKLLVNLNNIVTRGLNIVKKTFFCTLDYDKNKKNLIINISKGYGSMHGKRISRTMLYSLKDYIDEYNIILLGHLCTFKYYKKILEDKIFGKYLSGILYYDIPNKGHLSEYGSWDKIYDYIYDNLNITDDFKIDKIFEVNGVLTADFKINSDKSIRFLEVGYNKSMNFGSIKNAVLPLYFTLALTNKYSVKLEHLLYDPQSPDYSTFPEKFRPINYERTFAYNSKLFNFKKSNHINTYLKTIGLENKKEYDFVFGYTVTTNDRKWLSNEDLFTGIDKSKIFALDKFLNKDTFIEYNEYLKYISKSKYTLVIPAYLQTSFSIIRFLESLYNNCIPLLYHTNYLDEVFSDVTDKKLLTDLIVRDKTDIINKIKTLNYEDLILKLKNKFLN